LPFSSFDTGMKYGQAISLFSDEEMLGVAIVIS
jgi:hypothetical protein